jgi:hypothetical protein
VTVSLVPVTPNIAAVSAPLVLDETLFALTDTAFAITFAPGTQSGEEARFLLQVDNGSVVFSDTIVKTLYGPSIPLVSDPADDINTWANTTGWDTTQEYFKTAPNSITDSPNATYSANSNTELVSIPVSLPAGVSNIALRFWARWEIEPGYDYTVLQAVFEDGAFENLCGRYTKPGSNNQLPGEPLYDGIQDAWVQEYIDLTPYAGQTIALRFRLTADQFQELDGFYVDDLEISYSEPGFVLTNQLAGSDFRLLPGRPNPASDRTVIQWENPDNKVQKAELVMVNAFGRVVHRQAVELTQQSQLAVNTASWPVGVYTYYLQSEDGTTPTQKLTIVR